MARERYTVPPVKDASNDFDDEFDNEGFDELSDDYEEDERYGYSGGGQAEMDPRRGNGFSSGGGVGPGQGAYEASEDSRKDHHNQLERKRRASIKSSYCELREAIPTLRDNKASRSVILQKAVEYLEELHRRNIDHVACVDHFSSENSALESKCREIENQVQMLLRQQRNNGYIHSNYQNYMSSTASRPSYRVMDEDSNDLSGSTNSTPNASTSRSIISSTSTSTNRNGTNGGLSSSVESQQSKFDNIDVDNVVGHLKDEENNCKISSSNEEKRSTCSNNRNNETGSNSSSVEYYDDIDEVVAAKRPRKS